MHASAPARSGSRRRRLAAVGAASMVLAAAAVPSVAAAPAHAADGYFCDTGSYKPNLGRLGAFGCTGSGSTNVFVTVNVVDINGTENTSGSTFFCTDFGPSGVPGHWAGDCT